MFFVDLLNFFYLFTAQKIGDLVRPAGSNAGFYKFVFPIAYVLGVAHAADGLQHLPNC